jgi:glycosyltransferase involved in cell wall biosynthesis
MLGDALKVLVDHGDIRLEVRGANPKWSADFRDGMQARGLWKDFAPRNELDAWLADADAFLIPMAFDARLRRRMETSFPSKLIEFAQLGKPLVVWGPEYCSAVQWARKQDRALCVTDPDPDALRLALEELAASFDEQQRLAAAVRQAAQTDFEPVRIRAQFIEVLREAVRTHKPRKA